MKKVVSEISGTVFSLPWLIVKDYGLFETEGIEMEFVRSRPSGVVPHTENPEEVNPVLGHVAFEDAQVSIYRAWEEGQVRRAYESKQGAKIIALRAAVVSQAIMVPPDSPPRLRYVKAIPYTDEIVEDTYHWMVRWSLISSATCATHLVDNRLPEAAATSAGD